MISVGVSRECRLKSLCCEWNNIRQGNYVARNIILCQLSETLKFTLFLKEYPAATEIMMVSQTVSSLLVSKRLGELQKLNMDGKIY